MKKSIVSLGMLIGAILSGCSEPEAAINASSMFSVSDYEYTMNDKQAVSISFGETQNNFCSATIYRASVAAGYEVSSQQKSSKDISVDCNWSGKYYVQSSKHQTSVKFEMLSIDPKTKTAEATVSVKLVEPSSGKYFKLGVTPLVISGEHFDHLTKKM